MGDLGYDDGLVHGHLWASESYGRPQVRREKPQARRETTVHSDDGYGGGYDDGLVHNHGWARSA